MKLKRLQIYNIASIERATIDFTNSKIADHDMFLICGPTGSGKSTILDAICLALFDTTPRIAGSAKNLINIFANDADGMVNNVNNVLHLVRKNAVEAAVTLDFVGSDNREYVAKWRVYRKGQYRTSKKKVVVDGEEREIVETKTTSTFDSKPLEEKLAHEFKKEWTLTDEDNFDTIKDVANKIKEVLRMNFDQFCKTTMLAQGDFTKFLQSTSEEKADILEKLVGTDKYSKVGSVINKTANAKKVEVDVMSKELDNIVFLNDDAKAAKVQEIAAANAKIQEIALVKKAIDEKLQWIEAYSKAIADEMAMKEALLRAEQRLNDDDAKQQLGTIELWNKTEQVRQALKVEADCKTLAEEIIGREVGLALVYDRALAGTASLAARVQLLEQKNQSLREYIDSQKPYEEMFGNEGVISATHTTVENDKKFITDNQPMLASLDQELKRQNEVKQKLVKDKEAATAEIETLEKEISGLKEQLAEYGADTIDADVKALNRQERMIDDSVAAYEQLNKGANDYEEKKKAAEEAVADNEKYQTECDKANELLIAATARLKESRELYERTKDSISDHAKVLRSRLHEGDTCPVCGSLIDRALSDDSFIAALRPLEERFNADNDTVEALTSAHSKAKALVTVQQKTVGSTAKAVTEAKTTLDKLKAELVDRCKALSIDNPDDFTEAIDDIKLQISKDKETLNSRQEHIRNIRKNIDSINAQITKIRKTQINVVDKSLDSLQKDIDLTQKKKSELSGAIDKANDAITKGSQQLKELINTEWEVPEDKDFFTELKLAADNYTKTKKGYNENAAEIGLLNQRLDMISVCQKNIESIYTQWTERDKLQPVEIDDISTAWTDLQRDANELHLTDKNNNAALAAAEKTISDFYNNHSDIESERVKQLLKLTNADIDEMRNITDAIKEECSNARTLYESAVKRKAELSECQLAEGDTAETLSAQKQAQEEQERELLQAVGRIQKELDTDEENLRLMGKKKTELDALRAEYAEWENLNRYLGSTNGKNFRNVAQSFILNDLLDKANAYLENITGRYTLYCNPGTLTIMMRDAYQGGVSRPTNTLSGGESFIISLSLALGLSSMQNVDFEVDTLFIDEGFGTLSPEFIDPVITSLKRLYEVYHRRVGIISHVEMLRNRIPVTIEVSRRGNSSSQVTIS